MCYHMTPSIQRRKLDLLLKPKCSLRRSSFPTQQAYHTVPVVEVDADTAQTGTANRPSRLSKVFSLTLLGLELLCVHVCLLNALRQGCVNTLEAVRDVMFVKTIAFDPPFHPQAHTIWDVACVD